MIYLFATIKQLAPTLLKRKYLSHKHTFWTLKPTGALCTAKSNKIRKKVCSLFLLVCLVGFRGAFCVCFLRVERSKGMNASHALSALVHAACAAAFTHEREEAGLL